MNTGLQNLGKYRLQERLEKVGRVEIWKAIDPSLRCYVTIKIIHNDQDQCSDPSFMAHFEREAKNIRRLHHPNIVRISDVHIVRPPESEDTLGYLVMDYIEGPHLGDYIHRQMGKFPPPRDIVHLFKAISSAIDYAHQKGIVHGDIKPSNILLDRHALTAMGEPMLTGFGSAGLQGTSTGILSLWGLDMAFYLSPEQCQGNRGDGHSDIYALGVILYEMCTGILPFQGDNSSAIMMQQVNAAPKPPILINPNMPPALSAIILHALEKNPQMRFPNAGSMATALAEVLEPGSSGLPATYISRRRLISIPQTPVLDHDDNVINSTAGPGSPKNRRLAPRAGEATEWRSPASTILPRAGASPAPTMRRLHSLRRVVYTPSTLLTPVKFVAEPATVPLPSFAPKFDIADEVARGLRGDASVPSTQPHHYLSPRQGARPYRIQGSLAVSKFGGAAGKSGLLTQRLHVALIAALLIVFVFSSLGTYLVLAHQGQEVGSRLWLMQGGLMPVVGHVYFISSWQAGINSGQGINDEVLVELQNIPAPQAGKSYYAWLLGDTNQAEKPWMLLGKVDERQGKISFLYRGDELRTNLLADCSRFLISEEDAHKTQNDPYLDPSGWRYYAELPQTRSSTDVNHFSMLDHLRRLLVQAPELDALGLAGGIGTWLLRNTEEILRWSIEARDRFMNIDAVRGLLVDILYYLDGECASTELQDVPPDMPVRPADETIAQIAQFALLNPCVKDQLKHAAHDTPHDYLEYMRFHLTGVIRSPGATQAMRMLAAQINTAITDVQAWLGQAHRDAVRLAHMKDVQLIQPSSLVILDDMALQAGFAYAGRINSTMGNMQEGVNWIYASIQRMATLNVTAYKGFVGE